MASSMVLTDFWAKVIVISQWTRLEWVVPQIRRTHQQSIAESASKLETAKCTRVFKALFLTDVSASDFHGPWFITALRKFLPNASRAELQILCLVPSIGGQSWEWPSRRPRFPSAGQLSCPVEPRSLIFESFLESNLRFFEREVWGIFYLDNGEEICYDSYLFSPCQSNMEDPHWD